MVYFNFIIFFILLFIFHEIIIRFKIIFPLTYFVISITTFLQFNFLRSFSICPSSFSSPSLLYLQNLYIKKYITYFLNKTRLS